MTPRQFKFSRLLTALADYPEPAVARFAALSFIRDQGAGVGFPPTARLLREIPVLTPDQQHRARDLLQHAANEMRQPDE